MVIVFFLNLGVHIFTYFESFFLLRWYKTNQKIKVPKIMLHPILNNHTILKLVAKKLSTIMYSYQVLLTMQPNLNMHLLLMWFRYSKCRIDPIDHIIVT